MIDDATLSKIFKFIDEDKINITTHAIRDMWKHLYYYDREFIIGCLKKGKHYNGSEIYKEKDKENIEEYEKKIARYYCIHKHSIFGKLILISFKVYQDIIVIHLSPVDKHSREGKVYYSL